MNKNKIIFFCALVIGAGVASLVLAADTNPSWNLPNIPGPDSLLNNLPSPINSFINSAKQIGDNIYTKSQNLNVNSVSPTHWFDSVNNWFIGVTGMSLVSIIKGIGDLIVWVLSMALDLIKWALSLIK